MTSYELGFMSKCAEAGLGIGEAMELMEKAAATVPANWLPAVVSKVNGAVRTASKARPIISKAGPGVWERIESWLRPKGSRFMQLLGGGNSEARMLTSKLRSLQDKLARFQAEGRLDAAKTIQHQIDSLRATGSKQGLISRLFYGANPGDQKLWRKHFGDISSEGVANELNKVKWARRGGMAALSAPVALPMASSVLGGGGGGYDGVDEYAQYQQPQYGNVPVYR